MSIGIVTKAPRRIADSRCPKCGKKGCRVLQMAGNHLLYDCPHCGHYGVDIATKEATIDRKPTAAAQKQRPKEVPRTRAGPSSTRRRRPNKVPTLH